ncbi:flavin-containing monooxygenase 5-like [Asterias amurensis]|uniref:flavin-containing monooxygenase 5-like n=1 Tax=Asterias amurensis TaxID=7602 RepID=UPI003AB24386
MPKVKRVAVIGGGVSGLLSLKSCLECGLEPVCFERGDKAGGVWQTPEMDSFDDYNGGSIYKCLVTNSSKEMMAISDFPFPKEYPPYLTPKHLITYYRDFIKHHGLEKRIRLATEVVEVTPSEDHEATGRWVVTSRPRDQNEGVGVTVEVFDAVIVSTGLYNEAFIPRYPGMEEFKGKIVHSCKFKSGEQFAGKTVLVVGSSHSAGDVAVDTSRHASQVYLSMRDGSWVVGRFGPKGVPTDSFANRRWRGMVPEAVTRKIAKTIFEDRFDIDNLGMRCKRELFDGYLMVNDEIHCRIVCGAIKCKPGIERFTPGGVVFEDGTRVEGLDAVVFATGYDFKFPYLKEKIIGETFEDLELYMHVWPARRTHPTLAAVGYVATSGAQSPVFELQSRWAAQVFLGNVQLPDVEERLTDVKRRKDMFFEKFGRHRIFFTPVPYSDEIAEKIGVKPNFTKLVLTDPKLALRCFFGPAYPPNYRLNGPYPWKGAREAIMNGWENTTYPTKTRTVAKPSKSSALTLFGGVGRLMGVMFAVVLLSLLLVIV